ncbi:MAG: hypothetical protein H0X38_06185 [Planctomycetes bacterium]|nr:hypothetical protein [Planctomycetota bacterium]
MPSQVKGSLSIDPSLIVAGAPAPIVTFNGGTTVVANYPMHWPSPPMTAYIAASVPYNGGNPTLIAVIYNGTTYTPTPASVIIPNNNAPVPLNLTLP